MAEHGGPGVSSVAAGTAILLCLLARAAGGYVDPDVYHEMALFRAAVELGRLPLEDLFAYTPTVRPSLQHEWGMGAILYGSTVLLGAWGLLLLRYILTAGVAVACASCARRRGASVPLVCALAPVGVLLASASLTTVRAQVVTMLATALLLGFLERDREGARSWIPGWLLLFLLWVNVHGGFVVGVLVFALHGAEQLLRRRPVRHLALVAALMGLALGATPYGFAHVPVLLRAILLDRPLVAEWDPLWRGGLFELGLCAGSLALALRAAVDTGWRRATGLPILLASAGAALLHQRHLGIYAVAWMCLAPGWIQASAVGEALGRLWRRRLALTTVAWCALGAAAAASAWRNRPFELLVPARAQDGAGFTYPVGAVDYLAAQDFRGNVMTPFHAGAFVSWKLHPQVRVSFDGRYEVAYPPGAEKENNDFYLALPGWRAILFKYPTDLVLAAKRHPVSRHLEEADGWSLVYQDDEYELWARPGLRLPRVDRRGVPLQGSFP